MALMLTGCGGMSEVEKIAQMPLVDALSVKEMNDYYAEEMKVKNIVQTTKADVDKVEIRDVTDEERSKAEEEIKKVESRLSAEVYEDGEGLTKQQYEGMKIQLDDRQLGDGEISLIGAIREIYVVDVEYPAYQKNEGTLKSESKYLGVHGIFRRDENLLPYIDEDYVAEVEKAVTEKKRMLAEQHIEGVGLGESDGIKVSDVDMSILNMATPESLATSAESGESQTEVTQGSNTVDNVTADVLSGDVDLKAYNNVLGASLSEVAIMPSLDMVFVPSTNGAKLGGYGILKGGSTVIKGFGIDASNTERVKIRYVFKTDILDPSKWTLQNIYLRELEIEGVEEQLAEMEKDIIPEFVEIEIKKIVERGVRVINDYDITGLASGNVFYSLRNAIYWGHYRNNVNFSLKGEVTDYYKRNGNYYLAQVDIVNKENTRGDEAGQGIFKDKYLVAIEQQLDDDSFIIVDWVRIKRETATEPSISYASNLSKRFSYLSLAGEVMEELKPEIKQTLQSMFKKAMDKDWQGYYDMLDMNTSMLSKTRRDDIYLTTKSWTKKKGSEKSFEYIGAVTDWLSGASDQVELMTREMVVYEGGEEAAVLTNYYLVSNFDDKWVVDEIKLMEVKEIKGADEVNRERQMIEGYKDENDIIKEEVKEDDNEEG